jgi:phosphoribosylanthranilate isomerase
MSNYRCRVKICGVKTPAVAAAAEEAGADFLGVVFAPGRRQVTPEAARLLRVATKLPLVGVFRGQDIQDILRIVEYCGLDRVQLHGWEPPGFLYSLPVPCWRSVAVAENGDFSFPFDAWHGTESFVFDTALPGGITGGTGKPFDWAKLSGLSIPGRFILAGGLNAANVGEAIRTCHPYAVDVSGGVEENGEKSPHLIRAFIKKVREVEADA